MFLQLSYFVYVFYPSKFLKYLKYLADLYET